MFCWTTLYNRTTPSRHDFLTFQLMAQNIAESNWKLFSGGHNEDISCVPVDTCGVVYGSQNWHFLTYGFISPSEYNCLIQVRL